ncbi:ABC transporter ATP-binding protein [Spiroplasma endosymbiont of Crioceris asparagi]|uniref:ABC transporter ATP-binding protein n=1 Tax=Spiroplasma endosymbiont of Crioceris asparagi TaxID=3066286 RepID=UPI0030CC04BF
MIEIKNISKTYGKNVGNFNINLNVEDGKVLGILGPNGAGKSTLIRQIMGFISSDSGEIKFDNLDIKKCREKILEQIGYISGELNLFDNLKGKQYINLSNTFKKNVDKDFVEKLVDYFQLDTERKIKKMSKGMKQKVAIIAAFMNKPKYLILDEPSSGLDPVMQKRFIKLVKKMKEEYNSTIIICSHIFEEIIDSADEIVFLKEGKIVDQFQASEIKKIEELKIKFADIYKDEVEI